MRTPSDLKPAHMFMNTRHEESVIIRTPAAMRTRRQLLLIGGIMGIVPTGLLFVFSQMTEIGEYDFGAVYRLGAPAIIIHMVLFITFAVFLWSRLRRISDGWVWAGTLGLMVLIYCEVFARCYGTSLAWRGATEFIIFVGITIGSGLAHIILATVIWYACMGHNYHRGVRVVVQEATCCAACGFDLSGKQSMVCSSCGISFTLEDLRTEDRLSIDPDSRKEKS